jgi:hypothetical protein
VSKQILRLEEAKPDVSGSGPFLEHRRVEVVFGGRATVEYGNRYLASLEGHELRVLGRADDGVIAGDGRVAVDAKIRRAVGLRVREVLPRGPTLAVVLGLFQDPKSRSR